MFRQLTALLILLAFAAHTLREPFLLLDYCTNNAAYAQHCINKARPQMHCNGKCQLMKKMREEEKNEQQNTVHKYDVKMAVLSSRSFYCRVTAPAFDHCRKTFYSANGEVQDISLDFFHPPQA